MPDVEDKQSKAARAAHIKLVRDLAAVLNDTGLSEIEMESGDIRVRVSKTAQTLAVAAPGPAPIGLAPIPSPAAAPLTAEAPPPARAAGDLVKSPMVGTAYLQPQPGAPAFTKVGDKVNEGQTLLLVEAMKTMNPIVAPRAGVVAEVLVTDGQPVEYGEALVVLA